MKNSKKTSVETKNENISLQNDLETKENANENAKIKTDGKERENITQENKNLNKKEEFIRALKFLGFSLSAGVIQLGSFEIMYTLIGWNNWWATYLISITLSVIWNFTFNRKFTFKSANNVPIAMLLVLAYYAVFTPISVFGGQALENIGWNGTIVTLLMMVLNFVTEFVYDRYVVFRKSINTNSLAKEKQN